MMHEVSQDPRRPSGPWRTVLIAGLVGTAGFLASCSDSDSQNATEQEISASAPEVVAEQPWQAKPINLTEIARYETGIFDESAIEITAWEADSQRLFTVNGARNSLDILKVSKDGETITLTLDGSLVLAEDENPTSVAVKNGQVAVAVHRKTEEDHAGKVIFFDLEGNRQHEASVGDLPDMITFTPDGRYVLTANEGEPTGLTDPKGSISIIDLRTDYDVRTASFGRFLVADAEAEGIRLFPGKSVSLDVEPEFITVTEDSATAYVALQEANAIAIVDIAKSLVTDLVPLGTKDHSVEGNYIDPSDKDDLVELRAVPVQGMYMPDAIASYVVDGKTYIVSANEGDARDEDVRLGKANLDPATKDALESSNAGDRLKISGIDGDTDGDGDIDVPHSYGTRSISIWDAEGTLVWDSGDQIARTILETLGEDGFNHSNDKNKKDNRSDDKGAEPEGVVIGEINGHHYAFVGLERAGGILVYDVTDPTTPVLATYAVDRNYEKGLKPEEDESALAKMGHLGPEGLTFITADESPLGVPLLAVAYEVSGTLALYRIDQ